MLLVPRGYVQRSAGVVSVADVFSIDEYTGNGSTQSITNGLNLSGEGGLVMFRNRSSGTPWAVYDTARGATKDLILSTNAAEATETTGLTSFNSNGFSIGALAKLNTNGENFVAWSFRKAPGFLDIVTYTGTGSNRTIAHALGSAPGMIIVKKVSSTGGWATYHRSLSNTQYWALDVESGILSDATYWNSTTATDTVFSLGTSATVNQNGASYVAYVFGHDTSDDGIIQCGTYTGNGTNPSVNITLGWQPQFVGGRNGSIQNDSWAMVYNLTGTDKYYLTDIDHAEFAFAFIDAFSTGYRITDSSFFNTNSRPYIYMAIKAE